MNDSKVNEYISDYGLISKSCKLLNKEDFLGRANLFYGEYKKDLVDMTNHPEYANQHIGMYNVQSIRILSVKQASPSSLYDSVMNDACELESVRVYEVRSKVKTYEESAFYNTGERKDYYFLGTKNGRRYIFSINSVVDGNVDEIESNVQTYVMPKKNCLPDVISVKRGNGVIQNVDFKKYCQVVAACEVGYNSYNSEWHKARCVALKNYALHKIWIAPVDKGFHVTDDQSTQVYNPSINLSEFPRLMIALNTIWNDVLVDSSGNVIETQYRGSKATDYQSALGKGSGILPEEESLELAKSGKTYKEILWYYYDNAKLLNYKRISMKAFYDHSYVEYSSYRRCSRCGKIIIYAAP